MSDIHYSRNALNTLIYKAATAVAPGVFVSSRREPVAPVLPTVFVTQSFFTPPDAMLLDMSERVYRWTVEISVFTNDANTAQSDAYNLFEAIEDALRAEAFRLDMCEPVENRDDPAIYRLEARFERVIGGGDLMFTDVLGD